MASEHPTKRGLTREVLAETLALPGNGLFEPDATLRPLGLRHSDRPVGGPRHKSSRIPFEGTGATLRVREPLAEGGMGLISLGEQGALRREVAVKTLKPELRDPDLIDRLLTEARITGVVEHPNIVPIYALQADDEGVPLMVMKRIHGVSWRAMLRNDEHPGFPADAQDRLVWHLRVLMDVCDAVHYAHSRGILHLDLKPDNVMIGGFRDVYLVDWGVAVSTREQHRGWLPMADEVSEVVGTPSYMAPEMVDRQSAVLDERTDVYLLGSVLHEILTGRPPHQAENVHEILYAAYESRPPRFDSDVPAELAAIATRAMDPRAERRFESAEAFRSAVVAFLEHRSSAALAEDAMLILGRLRVTVARERLRQEAFDNVRAQVDAALQREVMREFVECRFGFSRALKVARERARPGRPGGGAVAHGGASALARRLHGRVGHAARGGGAHARRAGAHPRARGEGGAAPRASGTPRANRLRPGPQVRAPRSRAVRAGGLLRARCDPHRRLLRHAHGLVRVRHVALVRVHRWPHRHAADRRRGVPAAHDAQPCRAALRGGHGGAVRAHAAQPGGGAHARAHGVPRRGVRPVPVRDGRGHDRDADRPALLGASRGVHHLWAAHGDVPQLRALVDWHRRVAGARLDGVVVAEERRHRRRRG
ncbi:MAG: serine/threonine protein kinase [Sandaracinaceae bacterium]|nr:serine/threonine protein kinase [Sandaracinaceae bacterium]